MTYRRRCILSTILVTLLIIPACAGDASEGEAFQVEERDGVTVITNSHISTWESHDEAPVRFVKEQVYGVEEAPQEPQLTTVTSAVVDDDGILYAVDRQNSRVVAFDGDGSVRWSAGERGEGPGEFNQMGRIALGSEHTLWIEDGRFLQEWTTDGSFVQREAKGNLVSEGDTRQFVGASADTLAFITSAVETDTWTLRFVLGETHEEIAAYEIPMEQAEVHMPISMLNPLLESTYTNGMVKIAARKGYQIDLFSAQAGKQTRLKLPQEDMLVGIGFSPRGMLMMSGLSVLFPAGDAYVTQSFGPVDVRDPDQFLRQQNWEPDEPIEYERMSVIDVFSSDFRAIGRLVFDGARSPHGFFLTADADGRLYTWTQDPFPQVRRYALHFK